MSGRQQSCQRHCHRCQMQVAQGCLLPFSHCNIQLYCTYIWLLIRATVVVQLCYVINVQTGCARGDPSPLTTTQRPTLNFNTCYITKEGCIYGLSETFTLLSKMGYCEGTYVKTLECKHHHRLR